MTSTSADSTTGQRFLTLRQVSEELGTSSAEAYALVRSGTLPAIKIGGRGQWRVGRVDLETYVAQAYQDTAAFIQAHQFKASGDR